MRIAVIGAAADSGRQVVQILCDQGHAVIATSRSASRLADVDQRANPVVFDIADPASSADFLEGVDRVVSVAHAATVPALLPRIPAHCERLVVTGSTMRDSAVPDPRAEAVRRSETAFVDSAISGSILHPTMIYGSRNEANVIRVLRLIDRWPHWLPLILPVPDGGRGLVQPVFVDDVAAALAAAVTVEPVPDKVMVVAGPEPFRLADMLRACATLRDRRLYILPLPTGGLIVLARLISLLTRRSLFSVDELRRTRENKAYDITPLRNQLGIEPVTFEIGLRRAEGIHQYGVERATARE